MSCWLLDKDHVDAVVQAMIAYELILPDQADETGRLLWQTNADGYSTNYGGRYDEDIPEGIPEYAFEPLEGRIDPLVAQIAARSVAYQSYEYPGWETCPAARLIERLVGICAERIPEFNMRFGAMDPDATATGDVGAWSIDDRKVYLRAEELRTGVAG